jgi:hypothetical protein
VGSSAGLHVWENSKKRIGLAGIRKPDFPTRNRVTIPIGWFSFNVHVIRINIEITADEEAQQLEGDRAQNCHRDLTIANQDYDLC